jgi:hypothetical protein
MNPADPKWLEILKASGWQTASLSIAFLVILFLIKNEVIPRTPSPLWEAVPAIGAIIFGFLSLGSLGSSLFKFYQPEKAYTAWRIKRYKLNEIREYIPFMTVKDKEIIGYLLHHNQRLFETAKDAGYAAPLLSKGIIRISAQQGQMLDLTRVPFEISDYIWTELLNHREKFQYKPPPRGETEVYPWAIHWMAR